MVTWNIFISLLRNFLRESASIINGSARVMSTSVQCDWLSIKACKRLFWMCRRRKWRDHEEVMMCRRSLRRRKGLIHLQGSCQSRISSQNLHGSIRLLQSLDADLISHCAIGRLCRLSVEKHRLPVERFWLSNVFLAAIILLMAKNISLADKADVLPQGSLFQGWGGSGRQKICLHLQMPWRCQWELSPLQKPPVCANNLRNSFCRPETLKKNLFQKPSSQDQRQALLMERDTSWVIKFSWFTWHVRRAHVNASCTSSSFINRRVSKLSTMKIQQCITWVSTQFGTEPSQNTEHWSFKSRQQYAITVYWAQDRSVTVPLYKDLSANR